MDQIVPVIEFLKKNRFWITCFLLATAMVVTWILATGELAKQTAANLGQVKSRISTYDAIMRTVANTGDRPVQVGSHYHFAETNPALDFDRDAARGMRLDIAAGTAVRFEPGQRREVTLVPLTGARRVFGFNQQIMGGL